MITISLDPTLLTLGPLHFRWFGVMALLAIVLGAVVAGREASRRGIAVDEVYSAAIWVLLAGAVGARLVHVLGRLDEFGRAPATMLALQEGGLSIYGGLFGGGIALALYARLRRLDLGAFFDAVAPGLLVGQSIGRIGSLLNGDAHGNPTVLPWAVAYTDRNSLSPILGVYGHPYPAYEILWNLVVLGTLIAFRRRLQPSGATFLLYAVLYSAGRFGLEFYRIGPVWLGLHQAQVLAAAVLLVSAVLLVRQALLAARAASSSSETQAVGRQSESF